MLATNCNNFEMFGFSYCLLNIDPHLLTTPPIYALLANIITPSLLNHPTI